LFFSGESSGAGAKIVLLGGFAALVAAVGVSILGAQRSMRISDALVRLQDTTAQIRVRGAFLLLVMFVVLAEQFGLEAILGAFLAGAVLKLVDRGADDSAPRRRAGPSGGATAARPLGDPGAGLDVVDLGRAVSERRLEVTHLVVAHARQVEVEAVSSEPDRPPFAFDLHTRADDDVVDDAEELD